jgi:hypothetical protein
MKRKFLVSYDYGMGGAWAYVLAESEADIAARSTGTRGGITHASRES